jgi:hypothetical protein
MIEWSCDHFDLGRIKSDRLDLHPPEFSKNLAEHSPFLCAGASFVNGDLQNPKRSMAIEPATG